VNPKIAEDRTFSLMNWLVLHSWVSVVKVNPAVRLDERLGCQITHQDDRKFYMRRDPDPAAQTGP
jgi:hypothetical protein